MTIHSSSFSFSLTPAANAYIKKCLDKEGGAGFRISVKKTGCSGYSYCPSIVTTVEPADIRIESENGVTVFIDSAWQSLLQGLQVDYIEEEKAGLKQKRLVFSNPNEANRCGCGESFHINEE